MYYIYCLIKMFNFAFCKTNICFAAEALQLEGEGATIKQGMKIIPPPLLRARPWDVPRAQPTPPGWYLWRRSRSSGAQLRFFSMTRPEQEQSQGPYQDTSRGWYFHSPPTFTQGDTSRCQTFVPPLTHYASLHTHLRANCTRIFYRGT